MDTLKRYVVGFAFAEDLRTVLLIRKNRPSWQTGRWNGVGGKVEPGEDYLSAMVREFREETGLDVPPDKWKHIVTYHGPENVVRELREETGFEVPPEEGRHLVTYRGPEYVVQFFSTVTDRVSEAVSLTDEPVERHDISTLIDAPVISNLRWIIPLCLDQYIEMPVIVREPSP
jgi:8-oxo-dGTP diphosphatase